MTSDAGQSFFTLSLPPLHGANPPAACPICCTAQVPPESDEGLPPIEQCQYGCDATYLRPEDESGPWNPYRRCWRVPLPVALCIIAEMSNATMQTESSSEFIEYAYSRLSETNRLLSISQIRECLPAISLPPFGGERAPDQCPVCKSGIHQDISSSINEPGYTSLRIYDCGAAYWATITRPGASGQIPQLWNNGDACAHPPMNRMLEVLMELALCENQPEAARMIRLVSQAIRE